MPSEPCNGFAEMARSLDWHVVNRAIGRLYIEARRDSEAGTDPRTRTVAVTRMRALRSLDRATYDELVSADRKTQASPTLEAVLCDVVELATIIASHTG